MSVFHDWPHRWFGNFREKGEMWGLCPSILEFVDPNWDGDVRRRALTYLESGFCLAASTRGLCLFAGYECFHDVGEDMGLCARSDGDWTWDNNLTHYVRHHQIRIPDAMVRHMEGSGFTPPDVLTPADGDWLAYSQALPHAPLIRGAANVPHILFPRLPEAAVEEVRRAASEAFRSHNYLRLVELYALIERELTLPEQRKLAYAKARVHVAG
jgi:hypothetical protein